MKRSAAILGPTAAFLSWTIVQDCPFRDPDARKPVDAAFRELRSLRAIAVGEIEQRIFAGFCLHPNMAEVDAAELTGFPVDEVYAAFGGEEDANAACQNCAANIGVCHSELESVTENRLSKAGCFGWLPFGDHHRDANGFLSLLESEHQDRDSRGGRHSHQSLRESSVAFALVDAFEEAINSIDLPNPFPKTSPAWFGVWSRTSFSNAELKFLAKVCSLVRCDSLSWRRLATAIERAYRNDMKFLCTLMPPGNSDGANWVIEPQCRNCGAARHATPCQVCGNDSAPCRSRTMKVLGLRPYLKLSTIVGEEGVARLKKLADKT